MTTLAERYTKALSDLPIEVGVVQSDNKSGIPSLYFRYAIGWYVFNIHTRVEDDFDAHVKAIKSFIERDIRENRKPGL